VIPCDVSFHSDEGGCKTPMLHLLLSDIHWKVCVKTPISSDRPREDEISGYILLVESSAVSSL